MTASAVSISITGPEQVVYDYSTMACESADHPDGPTRALRDSLGRIQLMQSAIVMRRMIGPNFDSLTHQCTPVAFSAHNEDPAAYDDNQWITAMYTVNGKDVFALAHNEYHGQWHPPGACPGNVFRNCHWDTVTFFSSANNGDSYSHPPGPANLIASMPYRYIPDAGRHGFFGTSNIVSKDGWYYVMLLTTPGYKQQKDGVCLARTHDLADPASWRAWDGATFSVRFVNPYRESPEPIGSHVCEPVSNDEILEMNRSVTWNTYLNKWVLTGTSGKYDPALSRVVWGFYFSLSDDLIQWTPRQLILETETIQTYVCGDPEPMHYPTLIDPDSTDPNFGTTDQTAQIYFTRIHVNAACQITPDRDLLRIPVQFSP